MLYETPAKVAERIGKSRRWVVARCKESKLPFIKENGRYLIDTDKLEEAFSAMEAASNNTSRNFAPQEYGSVPSRYRLD